MDGHLIFEFETQQEANACLNTINDMASDYWKGLGYTVIEGGGYKELIGKKNGQDNPDAVRTLTWDVVRQSPDGTYYFSSLSNDTRFSAAVSQLEAAFNFVEKPYPAAWIPVPEEFALASE